MKLTFKSIFICLALFICNESSAQMRLGLMTNFSVSQSPLEQKLLVGQRGVVSHGISYLQQNPSYAVGLTTSAEYGYVWLRGACLYRSYEEDYSIDDFEALTTSTMTDRHHVIEVPITSGVQLADLIQIGLGPVFRYTIDRDLSLLDYAAFSEKDNSSISSGFQFLFGINLLERLQVEVVLEQSLRHNGENYQYMDVPLGLTGRNRHIGLNLNFNL